MPTVPADLQRALAGVGNLLILTHDNPDPDALASAAALRYLLAEGFGLDSTIAFAGMIGRAENRAMVKLLELDVAPLSTVDTTVFDGFALVDTQPGTGNNSLGEMGPLKVVIDHHPVNSAAEAADFVDVRESYGASATLLSEYAEAFGLEYPRPIATALFYAVRSETQDLGRDAGVADRDAYVRLLQRADMRAVARIQRARVPREYFGVFRDAIHEARLYANVVIADLGAVSSPDLVAEMADFLLRLEGAEWACCIGQHRNQIVLSVRTADPDAHAGRLVRNAVRGIGTAGGHGSMAGGQVPLGTSEYLPLAREVAARLRAEIGVDDDVIPEPLVRD